MNVIYPAICHYEDEGFWSEFPDLEGCFSQGNTEQEIIANSKESLEGYVISLLEAGNTLPKARSIKDITTPDDGFVTYIEGDISASSRHVRKNVTLPDWLSKKAEKEGVNFSQVLQEALKARLAI